MPKHVIRVEYLESQGTIDSLSFNVEPNNLSSKALNDLTNVNVYTNGFLLNLSDLSGKYEYFNENGVKYYISSVASDSNSNINVTLSVTTTGASAITLIFAKEIYPTQISINGQTQTNSDDTFQVYVSSVETTTTTITFTKMNLPNVPLIITNINTGISIDYTDDYIINWTRGSQLSTDNQLPKYEIVGQYGSCSFVDSENVVLKLKANNVLKKPKSVKFFLDDNLIGSYKVDNWEYETTNSVVKLNLIDSVDELSDILIESKSPEYKPATSIPSEERYSFYTAYDFFLEIKLLIEAFGETFDTINQDVINWLSSIKIKTLKYDATNLNDLVVDFCNLTQTSFYKTQDGKVGVYSWR